MTNRRIAGSSTESAGRLSIDHSSIAARSAVMPDRPCLEWAISAASSAGSVASLQCQHVTDSARHRVAVDRPEVAHRAQDVGAGDAGSSLRNQVQMVGGPVIPNGREGVVTLGDAGR